MALLIASIMSLELLKVPTVKPYTAPGIQNNKNISGTIDCISGELKFVKEPSLLRIAESAGADTYANNAIPAIITELAIKKARFSSLRASSNAGRS